MTVVGSSIKTDLSTWAGQRVLITGGSGFLGRRIVQLGLTYGIEVHSASLRADAPGSINHHIDLTDREHCVALIRKTQPAGIIHLAAGGVRYGSGTFSDLFHVNVVGLEHLFSALDHPVPVVIAGSGFEYAPQGQPVDERAPLMPTTAYGASKVAAFGVACGYALRLPVTWIRPFSLYGVGEQSPRLAPYIIEQAIQGQPCELTPGEQIRDYLYIDDAAKAFWMALINTPEKAGMRVFNIGTGTRISLREFVEALGQTLKQFNLSPQLKFGAKPYRPDEIMTYCAEVQQIDLALGWKAETSLQDGLRKMVEASLAH